jgi:hypothetical protein
MAQDRNPPWQPTPEDIAVLGIDPADADRLRELTLLMNSAYLAGRADTLNEQAARWDKLKLWGMPDDLPTARSMLPNDSWLCLSMRCRACFHHVLADLRAIIDAGQDDWPIKDLRFRCTECGSSRTDHVVTSRDSLRVAPTFKRFVRQG